MGYLDLFGVFVYQIQRLEEVLHVQFLAFDCFAGGFVWEGMREAAIAVFITVFLFVCARFTVQNATAFMCRVTHSYLAMSKALNGFTVYEALRGSQ